MSHYLSEQLDGDASDSRKAAITEGILNLKGTIRGLKHEPKEEEAPEVAPVEHKFDKTELADRSIEMYKKNSIDAPTTEKEVLAPAPTTIASRELMKATIRGLTGQRNGGDEGKPCIKQGGASIGTPAPASVSTPSVLSMSVEEYQAHVYSSLGLIEEEEVLEEVIVEENENEVDAIGILEAALLDANTESWMDVDRVVRAVCEECEILPKELNREFRSVHGQYPDKWVKNHFKTEECGYYPLEEAHRMMKVGNLYDVSFVFRGSTERFQFFWPEVQRPTFDAMQDAVRKFYPKARLLSYYLAANQQDNGMVIVPPMTENYHVVAASEWTLMSDSDKETFDTICEEEGEPVNTPQLQEDGTYSVLVADHDTGKETLIVFGEAAAWTKKSGQNSEGGLNEKGRKSYERENPGSDLKRPQPEGGKRRDSYCSRSKGQQDMHNIDCSKDPEKRICKARKKWNC